MDHDGGEPRSRLPWLVGPAAVLVIVIAVLVTRSNETFVVAPVDRNGSAAAPPPPTTRVTPSSSAPTTTTPTIAGAAPPSTEAPRSERRSVPTTRPRPTSTTTTVAPILPATARPARGRAIDAFPGTDAAFGRLAGANAGASLSVVRGGEHVVGRAAGATLDGAAATSDSPMVVASVSKMVVALGIARLADEGLLDVGAPVPWPELELAVHPGWADVTTRELLDHTSGLATARESWFTGEGTCRDHVPSLLTDAPRDHRGTWVYSNANYCVLGLVVEQITGEPLDAALQELVLDPIRATGIHLTGGGLLPGDLPHDEGVERLSRLGGAGEIVVSTDDLAMMFARMTPADRSVLRPPAVFVDQYGFGHTGTVTGAKSCVWVLEGGVTVVAATIAGDSAATGGELCDVVVPAVTSDLGLGSAEPERTP